MKTLVSLLIIDRAHDVIHYRSLLRERWQQDTVAGNSLSLTIKQKAWTNLCRFHSALGTVSTCHDGSRLLGSVWRTLSPSLYQTLGLLHCPNFAFKGGIAAIRTEVEPLTKTRIY